MYWGYFWQNENNKNTTQLYLLIFWFENSAFYVINEVMAPTYKFITQVMTPACHLLNLMKKARWCFMGHVVFDATFLLNCNH